MEVIQFSEVMRLMNKTDNTGKPVPFSLKVVTYNRSKNTGGTVLDIPKAVISRQTGKSKRITPKKYSPRHYENATKNILLLPSMEIRKIHPRLIIEFNNKQMIY